MMGVMRDETPAFRFTQHLNDLTEDIGKLGLYWRGDLAQFFATSGGFVHVCGVMIAVSQGDRLDMLARQATTHLLGCELRQGQAPMPQASAHQDPETNA